MAEFGIIYAVTCEFSNSQFASPTSTPVLAVSTELPPTQPPQNVNATHHNTTVMMSWTPPPLHDQLGNVTRYSVRYLLSADTGTTIRICAHNQTYPDIRNVDASTLHALIRVPATSGLWFAVAAVNSAGAGPYSPCLFIAGVS